MTLEIIDTDQIRRLDSCYRIRDKRGQKVQFKLNATQRKLLSNWKRYNLVVKARRTGVSTVTDVLMLDTCLFNVNEHGVVLVRDSLMAEAVFQYTFMFALENIYVDRAGEPVPQVVERSRNSLTFTNGSKIEVRTKLPEIAPTRLHVPELGFISAVSSSRARDILALADFMAHQNHSWVMFDDVFYEAENNYFGGLVQRFAENKGASEEAHLPYLHFFPWYEEPAYATSNEDFEERPEDKAFFDKIEKERGLQISKPQRNWYVTTRDTIYGGDDALMKREFPSSLKGLLPDTAQ